MIDHKAGNILGHDVWLGMRACRGFLILLLQLTGGSMKWFDMNLDAKLDMVYNTRTQHDWCLSRAWSR